MTTVRPPAVAGLFYPGDAATLASTVDDLLREAGTSETTPARAPKALIAPHAGYVYSGPVAARAYARLRDAARSVERVVLLGPAHYVPTGIALSSASAFSTPLGDVPVEPVIDALRGRDAVEVDDRAHGPEHSLEVQLPFLQRVLGEFRLVPIVVGDARDEAIRAVVDRLWGGDETLVVVSTDLSHYLDHAAATDVDRATAAAILRRDPRAIGAHAACGARPLRGLLLEADSQSLDVEQLALCNSGDTAGPKDRVVGYGAFALR
jgi:AmmeMemoRadiSam system protein B